MNLLMRALGLSMLLLVIGAGGCKPGVTYKSLPAPVIFEGKPRNVILLIGDGMGLAQASAVIYDTKGPSPLEACPIVGFHKPASLNDLITDSGAGATAFACGMKSYLNAIGMDPDTMPCKTILEEARNRGLATGVIATSSIVHATPAAFFAHQPMRTDYEPIAADLVASGMDFFVGGGKKYFDRREMDNRNLLRELELQGYDVRTYFEEELQQVRLSHKRKFIYFSADNTPLSVFQGRNYLPYAVSMATRFLSRRSEEGFFLVVEGSQIDWKCHANNGQELLLEMHDFMEATEAALQFAAVDRRTLVLITGDHETGGLAIEQGSRHRKLNLAFTTNGHTAALVPVYAFGPGAETFSGIYENTEIYHKLMRLLNFE
jgi:alkaline phosphatase